MSIFFLLPQYLCLIKFLIFLFNTFLNNVNLQQKNLKKAQKNYENFHKWNYSFWEVDKWLIVSNLFLLPHYLQNSYAAYMFKCVCRWKRENVNHVYSSSVVKHWARWLVASTLYLYSFFIFHMRGQVVILKKPRISVVFMLLTNICSSLSIHAEDVNVYI